MTVNSTLVKEDFITDGIETDFSYNILTPDGSDLQLYENGELTSKTYTVTITPSPGVGGLIQFTPDAPDAGQLTILRVLDITQEALYNPFDPFPAKTHERALDLGTMVDQQLQEQLDRALLVHVGGDPNVDYTLPPYEAGKGIMWTENDPKGLTNSNEGLNDIVQQAETARDASVAAAITSEDWSDLSNLWAEEAEDVPVAPGQFSAFHWAKKAEGSATLSPVSSVFTRIGDVVAVDGDYDIDLIGRVDINSPTDGHTLVYDTGAFVNEFMSAILVTNTPSGDISATDVQGAIDELDTSKSPVTHTHVPSDAIAEPVPTGLTDGGEITQIPANFTEVHIDGGSGFIINAYDDYENVTVTPVSWLAQDVALLNPLTETRSHFRVDNTGTILVLNTPPTPTSERTTIHLGQAWHDPIGSAEPLIFNSPHRAGLDAHGLIDLVDFIGPLTRGFTPVPNADLTFGHSGGEYFSLGINHLTDSSNPNELVIPPIAALDFYYFTGDGTIQGTLTTLVDAENYDPAGVGPAPESVPGGPSVSTIQYFFGIVPGIGGMLYGQNTYGTLEEAKDEVFNDLSSLVIPQALQDSFGPLYAVASINTATDLSDPLQAKVFNLNAAAGIGGSGGGGTPGAVTSVFGRIGDVVSVADDYNASLITFDPSSVAGVATNVQDNLEELDAVTVANAAQIDTNTGNITTNASNILTNAGDITVNSNAIIALDAVKVNSDPTVVDPGAGQVINMVQISQVDYDGLVPDVNTLYLIDS